MKLLIVDDHAGVRTLIRQLATRPADLVRECATGEEAVQLARDFAPDVVTMDIGLPGMSGFAATRAICTLRPAVRVVIVSSCDQPELRRAAQAAGAAAYVVKDNLSELPPLLSPDPAKAQPAEDSQESGAGEGKN